MATPKEKSGCLIGMFALFVQMPLWFAIVYGILSSVNPPQWTWYCLAVYLPVCICGIVINTLYRMSYGD